MKKVHIKLLVVGIVILGIGFMGGMEYKKYQIRNVIGEAFSGVFGEEKSVASETKNEKPDVSNDLTKKVGLEITNKGFSEGNFTDYNTFTFKLTNTTDKDIEGVKGLIVMRDLFGDQITGVTFSYDKGIKVGESKLYNATVDYNQFMEKDIKLRQTPLEKMKYEWSVNTIVYTDGTQESF
jgi:hypothetical protein